MRRKQFHTFDHALLLVIEEPILTRLEACNDRMPCRCRMLGCMLTRRTVAATDVPTLRTPTKMKPPTFRRCQAFDTPLATRLRSGVDSAVVFLHVRFSFRRRSVQRPNRASLHRVGDPDGNRDPYREDATPFGSPGWRIQWVSEILCFSAAFSFFKLHDTGGIHWFSVVVNYISAAKPVFLSATLPIESSAMNH